MKSDPDNRKPQGSLPLLAGRQILSIHHHTNTEWKKMTSHCVPAKYLHSFTLSYTHSSFSPPSISFSNIMAFCQWTYIFLPLPLQPPAFLFSCWLQIMICNGLRCWQKGHLIHVTPTAGLWRNISIPPHLSVHFSHRPSSFSFNHSFALSALYKRWPHRHHFLCSRK